MSKYSETYRLSGGITGSTRTRTWLALWVRTFLKFWKVWCSCGGGRSRWICFGTASLYSRWFMRMLIWGWSRTLMLSVPPDTGFMVAFDNVSTTRMRLKYMAQIWVRLKCMASNLRFDSASSSFSFPSVYLFWLLSTLQPGRNVKVGMCMAGFYRIGSRLIHSGRRHWECRQPRSNRFTTVDMAKILSQPRHYSIALLWSALLTGPCRLEHRSTEFWSTPEPVWAWEIMSSSDQPPVPGRTIILQQKRNGHAIVVRENNTITHEMYWWKKIQQNQLRKATIFKPFWEDFVHKWPQSQRIHSYHVTSTVAYRRRKAW
jgi:hypothetical protein